MIRINYATFQAIHQSAAALSITGIFAWGVGSLATFGYIVSVAITKIPAGFFDS